MSKKMDIMDAAVKCESNTGDDYSVGFLWSPDSV